MTSPVGGDIVAYNATNDEFELVQPAAGGGGGWEFISNSNFSTATTVDFDLTTHTHYRFFLKDIDLSATQSLDIRIDDSGGASPMTGTQSGKIKKRVNNSSGITGTGVSGQILVTDGAATGSITGWVEIINPSATAPTMIRWDTVNYDGTQWQWQQGIGMHDGDISVNWISFDPAGAVTMTGDISFFGLNES